MLHLGSMRQWLVIFIVLFSASAYYFSPPKTVTVIGPSPLLKRTEPVPEADKTIPRLRSAAGELKNFATRNHFSTQYALLADFSIPSGRKRLFLYDLQKDSIVYSGLVAHGSCREYFLEEPRFSNVKDCGCSSLGKYRIGYSYNGNFGKAFKLFGLDSSNSNAFERVVVFHSYEAVPDKEVYPEQICNSLGCPMVSPSFLEQVSGFIEESQKPVLLYIYK
jgi:hypothetical protein